jgi:predicted nucleic-acid-binding protein
VIGIDTNILVRYLVQDDAVQAAIATDIFERRLAEENGGFVSVIAMTETAWVLERSYGLSAQEIAQAIEHILQVDLLTVENEHEVFTAMIVLKTNRGSFSDTLIAALGTRAGCSRTLTFDRRALRLPGFVAA